MIEETEEINIYNKLKFNYIKTLRKILKLWRINIGIPVLIIQILKIFGLNLNITTSRSSNSKFSNHPNFLNNYTSYPKILQFRVCKTSNFKFVHPPIFGLSPSVFTLNMSCSDGHE